LFHLSLTANARGGVYRVGRQILNIISGLRNDGPRLRLSLRLPTESTYYGGRRDDGLKKNVWSGSTLRSIEWILIYQSGSVSYSILIWASVSWGMQASEHSLIFEDNPDNNTTHRWTLTLLVFFSGCKFSPYSVPQHDLCLDMDILSYLDLRAWSNSREVYFFRLSIKLKLLDSSILCSRYMKLWYEEAQSGMTW
jgi:hypothetical protein